VTHDLVQSATALPAAPVDDRKKRMRAYSTAMSIRMLCLILVFFVPWELKIVFGVGAVVLPYIAVVLANAGSRIGVVAIDPGPGPQRLPEIESKRPE
jgi:hypothetical protein